MIDAWLPVIDKLKKTGNIEICFIFPEPSALITEDNKSDLFNIAERYVDNVVYRGYSGELYTASTLIEARNGIKFSPLDEKIYSLAVRLYKGKASKFILLKYIGKFLLVLSKYIAYIKEKSSFLNPFNFEALKFFNGVLCDITVVNKKSNNAIMEKINFVPKFSMLHGLNAPWVEAEFNCKQSVKIKSNVTVYTASHLEASGYNRCFGISNENIVRAGIPRHDSAWIEFILKQSKPSEEAFESFVFIIGRPASPYNTVERKREALRNIYNTICAKYKLKLVVKTHPKESLDGVDGEIYKSALGLENYGKDWIFSNNHPFVLGKKAIFCISFYSGVVIDMLALKKPTIEYLNLNGLELYDNSNSLRDKNKNSVFAYSYTNLVFGARCKQDFDLHVESILTQYNAQVDRVILNYKNFYRPFDGSSKMICDDILKKLF